MLKIYSFPLGIVDTVGYLLIDADLNEAILIDAPQGILEQIQPILKKSNTLLKALLLTHGHWDHIYEAHFFQEQGIPIYGHLGDKMLFEMPVIQSFFIPELQNELKPVEVDHWLEQGQEFNLLNRTIEIRHVPGHALGSVMFYLPEEKMAFVGDAIFAGSVGRTDLPAGDFKTLEKSIQTQIYTLPEDTVLYPGHGPATSVDVERKSNPYIRDKRS